MWIPSSWGQAREGHRDKLMGLNTLCSLCLGGDRLNAERDTQKTFVRTFITEET